MQDVKLKKPHTHAGRRYPAGATIRNLRPDQADWLEALGVAEPHSGPTDAAVSARHKTSIRAKE